LTPASIIPVFGSQRPYADLNFAGGSFGLDGRSVSDLTALPGFTFTRASLAMGYDGTGKLVYGPNNLLLQSQTLDNASWTLNSATITANAVAAPDGTLTADKLVEVAATTNHYALQVVTTSANQTVISTYAKAAERSFVLVYHNVSASGRVFNLSTGALGGTGGAAAPQASAMQSVGNGWYRCSITVATTAAANQARLYVLAADDGSTSYAGDGTSGIFLWGAQLEAVTYQTTPSTYYPTTTAAYYGPRLVYDPVTLASLGILVEEARTNSLIQSNGFTNVAWQDAGPNLATAAAAVSPDGTTNASLITATATNSIMREARTLVASTVYTGGFFLKAGTSTRSRILIRDTTAGTNFADVTFTWSGGVPTVSGSPTGTWTIQSVGGGWYRITGYGSTGATPTPLVTFALLPDDLVGTGTVYCYEGSLEAGTGASSPIPTTTAAVTRAADAVTFTGLSAPAPYSVVAEFNIPRAISSIDLTNWGTLANGGGIYTTPNGQAFVRESNATTANVSGGALSANVTQKVAARYAINDVNASVNGGIGTADTSVTPPTMTNIGLGPVVFQFGGLYPNGTFSRIRIYNRALPDAQLQSLTT
jgi:hypothetical protein